MSPADQSRPKFDPLARRSWTDLGPRFGSAIVLIIITAIGLYLGGFAFAALVAAVFAGCYREWDRMVTLHPVTTIGGVLIGLLAVAALAHALFGPLATIGVLAIALLVAIAFEREHTTWRVAGLLFFGAVVLALFAIRGTGQDGILAALFLGIVVWLTDTGAFFTGRQVGGEKLAPDISPGKTWSGAIGGFAIGTLAGLVFWLFTTASPWWIGLALAAGTSIFSQLGDLAESAVKRRFRIKDSGDIIPGHGGLMDRLDSLTFPALLLVAVGLLHGGTGELATAILRW